MNQPPAGQAIEKRHQHIIAPDQHPPEALADDVPGVDHAVFELEVVEHIEEGENLVERHRQGEPAVGFVLHGGKRGVEQRQSDERGPVAEKLQVQPEPDRGGLHAVEESPPRSGRCAVVPHALEIQPAGKREGENVRGDEQGRKVVVQHRKREPAEDLTDTRGGGGDQEQGEAVELVDALLSVGVRALDPAAGQKRRTQEQQGDKRQHHCRRAGQLSARQRGKRNGKVRRGHRRVPPRLPDAPATCARSLPETPVLPD